MTIASTLSLHDTGISLSLSGPVSNFLTKHAPRLYCYLETPHLLWANVVMDTLIAASYAVIFLCLLWISRRLHGQPKFAPYLWVSLSFGLFIVACGGTHLMDVVDLWWPSLKLATGIRILCAAASVPTAILFARATPTIEWDIRRYVEMLAHTRLQRDLAQSALTAAQGVAEERGEAAEGTATVNRQLNSVMNSTTELILQVGPDWKILYGNQEAERTLPDFRVGADFWRCFPGLKGTEAAQHFLTGMRTHEEQQFSNYYEPYSKWYRVHIFSAGSGISIFVNDITLEKTLEEALAEEISLREKHVEQLSHMAAGLAHEISNPLAIIHARASDLEEMAADGTLPSAEAVQKTCHSIVLTAERAKRILHGLKGLSREASKDPMEQADIGETCRQCVDLQSSQLLRYHIAMRLVVAEDLPKVLCRETQIGQVVSNLLSNGFDAVVESGAAGGWISVEVEQRGGHLCIRVSDSGPGISKDIRGKLMTPFFTTKPMGAGTGVGLSLSESIARDHGGSLTLLEGTSHTSFELLLPVPASDEITYPELVVSA